MKAVIFDWSGVIKDVFDAHYWAVSQIFKKTKVGPISKQGLRDNWKEPYMLFYKKYIPGITMKEEQKLYKEVMLDEEFPRSKPFLGIVELVKKLKKSGYFIGVVSADFVDTLGNEIKEYGLEDFLDIVVGDVHEKTEAVSTLIEENKLDTNKTFVVGDSRNEVIAAKNNHVKSVAVTWGLMSRKRLQKEKPDYLVDTVDELKKILI